MSSTNSEDDTIQQLMSAVDHDATLPDAAFLAELREQSAAEFVSAEYGRGAHELSGSDSLGGAMFARTWGNTRATHVLTNVVTSTVHQTASRRQKTWVTAIAGTALVAVVWLIGVMPRRDATLGEVLASVNQTSALRMRIETAGETREIVAAAGGRVRWSQDDGKYVIGREGRLWQVDELANRAESHESAAVADGRVDVVAMLWDSVLRPSGSGLVDRNQPRPGSRVTKSDDESTVWRTTWREKPTWLAARASEVVNRDGREFRVYRATLDASRPRMRIEAVADAADNRLQSLRLTDERDGREELLAAVTVLAWDEAVEANRFVVRESLTEDGRIGKVTKPQGIVSLQPVVAVSANLAQVAQRWTPVCEETLLRSGDWLRTDSAGANAVAVKLVPDMLVVLGPGSLAEFVSPSELRLHSGEVEITVAEGRTFKLSSLAARSAVVPRHELPSDQPASDVEKHVERAEGANRNLGHGMTELRSGTHIFRVDSQREPGALVKLERAPTWLLGFKGTMPQESLGSLVANIDGRNVPLSVGYHKVSVDIRDQIARTVIEESFVNHSDARTEGTFFFPLPADASISGFGMWIGEELVEADIVEKQRAREIFETILREKRDPGLLEWAGGNLFKARVFPIEARSEKRVKITYTQVLPGRGRKFRYSYALQSELLRQHPLRELSIDVTVSSAVPLRSVKSPTHLTRDEITRRAGRVRFAAQNHTPTRDFEVVVETEQPPSNVVLIPHRRGDDGYFLMQFTPPGSDGDWDRELLPSSEPLSLLILADTSGSMDDSLRRTQADFVSALLASLSPRDSFNLATCDVTCDWAFDAPRAVSMNDINTARSFLAKRRSLGWTDLRTAVKSAMAQGVRGQEVGVSKPQITHIIYLGDGIVTTGTKTPEEFANALPRLVRDVSKSEISNLKSQLTFHAVAVGSTFEWPVLKALGAIGGGSVRRLSGEQTPMKAARDLLIEIASPGLRDVKVEFAGLSTTAVYPSSLPNLPLGTQQIVVGKYLPEIRNPNEGSQFSALSSQPSVIVIGTLNGKPIRLTAPVRLPNTINSESKTESSSASRSPLSASPDSNSFIPRLWARQHLDHLLEQGQSAAVKNDVIAMSEEFHIITPYTSLLVLESDADRERFGVKRRFQMRDGEKFFAAGRDNANYELIQKQMQAAQLWRQQLRDKALSQLSSLGRDIPLRPRMRGQPTQGDVSFTSAGSVWMDDGAQGVTLLRLGDSNKYQRNKYQRSDMDLFDDTKSRYAVELPPNQWSFTNGNAFWDKPMSAGGGSFWRRPTTRELLSDSDSKSHFAQNFLGRSWNGIDENVDSGLDFGSIHLPSKFALFRSSGDDFVDGREQFAGSPSQLFDEEGRLGFGNGHSELHGDLSGRMDYFYHGGEQYLTNAWEANDFTIPSLVLSGPLPMIDGPGPGVMDFKRSAGFDIDGLALGEVTFEYDSDGDGWHEGFRSQFGLGRGGRGVSRGTMPAAPSELALLAPFPSFPVKQPCPESVRTRADVSKLWETSRSQMRPKPRRWSEEAWLLAESLLRTKTLLGHDAGLKLNRVVETYDTRWKEWTRRSEREEIVTPRGWLIRSSGDDAATETQWCNEMERGIVSAAFELGWSRRANAIDIALPPLGLGDFSLGVGDQIGLVERYREDFASIEQSAPDRKVLTLRSNDPTRTTRVVIDTARRVLLTYEMRQNDRVELKLECRDFVQAAGSWWPTRIEQFDELGRLKSVTTQTVKSVPVADADARIEQELTVRSRCLVLQSPLPSVAEARRLHVAGTDHLVLAMHFASSQQWDRAWEQLEAAESLANGKHGFRWIRDALLNISRRHEELLQRLHEESKGLAVTKGDARWRDGDLERLANHVISVAGSVAEADERLSIVDRLRPVFERQEPRRQGLKAWREMRHSLFASAGQSEEAAELLRLMAETYRHDLALQQSYAQQLMNLGDRQGAEDWLRKQLKPDAGWTATEEWSIRHTIATWMQSDGRFRELERWLTESLEKYSTFEGYRMLLETLRRLERQGEVDELVLNWLNEGVASVTRGVAEAEHSEPRGNYLIRLGTALKFIADGHGWTNDGVLPKYRDPLFEAVTVFLRREDQLANANTILGLEHFRKSPNGRRVLAELVPYLRDNLGKLSSDHSLSLLAWIKTLGEVHKVNRVKELREPVRGELRKRWEAAADPDDKDRAANHLLSYLGGYSTPELVRLFRRELLRTTHVDYHEAYAAALFNDLLGTMDAKLIGTAKLNSRVESELFDVLLVLGPKEGSWPLPVFSDDVAKLARDDRQTLARIEGYQRLQNTLMARRTETLVKQLMPEPNKLKPEEQSRLRAIAQQRARADLLARLTGFTKRTDGVLADWLQYEQLLLLVDLNRELDRVVAECWTSIAGLEKGNASQGNGSSTVLRLRHLGLLTGLITQNRTPPMQAERLVTWLERRVAEVPKSVAWKSRLQMLLLALDRPKELERHLSAWADAAGFDFRWHVALGYLKAELGRLPEAIALFEQVEREHLLPAAEYRALAMWYQAVDRRADHERSIVKAFSTADEGRLGQQLGQLVNPWHGGGRLPSDVDPNLIRLFQALFSKSAAPQNYLWQLQRVYGASHDFRLLSMLPDAVIGHTAGTAYPFLSGMSAVLNEIRDEATADELIARLAEVRVVKGWGLRVGGKNEGTKRTKEGTTETTDVNNAASNETKVAQANDDKAFASLAHQQRASVVDLRSLDFLELQVERRAAELLNQPGPHIDRALAVLRRAFDHGDWSASEPRHYADMLGGLGQISQKALADEQLRQLRTLFDRAARGSFDRLQIGQRLADRLWDYESPRAATELLLAVLDEHLADRGGKLTNRASGAFALAVVYLNRQSQFIAAESLVQTQLDRVKVEGMKLTLLRHWLDVHRSAFADRGETSLGKGLEHYERLQHRLLELADTTNTNQQVAAFEHLSLLYQTANAFAEKDQSFERARADLDHFTTKRLRELMVRPANHFQNTLSMFANTIRTVRGFREAIVFVLDWIDDEPAWLKQQNQSGLWEYFRSTLAHWRREADGAGGLGDIEPRLLKRVLASLRNELFGHNTTNQDWYRIGSDYYWKKKEDDFERVAREVAVEKKDDVAVINFTAVYLNDGLGRPAPAIEILQTALKAKVLDEDGRSRLARYLADSKKFAEAIPLLTALIKEQPNNIDYRTRLMSAFFHNDAGRGGPVQMFGGRAFKVLSESEKHFRKVGWNEHASRALAEASLGCELFDDSVRLWKETIAAHEQSQPRRGIGNGTLSNYYSQLAAAYAGQKDSPHAVDAAVSAIVSWGPRHENRKQALAALQNVMRQSSDLALVAKHYDTEAEKTKLENPIVRKALGQVFLELKRPTEAIPQLRLALELQPNDLESHDALIASFDAVGDKAAAVQQVLDSAKLNRREIARLKDAGQRLQQLEQPAEAERAFTNIVESLPLEGESHSLLAEVRESQNCWPDAITHWQLAAEYRSLEPEPLLRLAAALIHEKRLDDAEPILRKLETTTWEQRFSDVLKRTAELRNRSR